MAPHLASSQDCTHVRRQIEPPRLFPRAAVLNRPQHLSARQTKKFRLRRPRYSLRSIIQVVVEVETSLRLRLLDDVLGFGQMIPSNLNLFLLVFDVLLFSLREVGAMSRRFPDLFLVASEVSLHVRNARFEVGDVGLLG